MKRFEVINGIQFEVLDQETDFVPNQAVDILDCVNNSMIPPEVSNLEYDSDDNGNNVSFDDASPIIPDKIAAMERLQQLEHQYAIGKEAAEKQAAEAQKMAAASATVATPQVSENQPSESAGA